MSNTVKNIKDMKIKLLPKGSKPKPTAGVKVLPAKFMNPEKPVWIVFNCSFKKKPTPKKLKAKKRLLYKFLVAARSIEEQKIRKSRNDQAIKLETKTFWSPTPNKLVYNVVVICWDENQAPGDSFPPPPPPKPAPTSPM